MDGNPNSRRERAAEGAPEEARQEWLSMLQAWRSRSRSSSRTPSRWSRR